MRKKICRSSYMTYVFFFSVLYCINDCRSAHLNLFAQKIYLYIFVHLCMCVYGFVVQVHICPQGQRVKVKGQILWDSLPWPFSYPASSFYPFPLFSVHSIPRLRTAVIRRDTKRGQGSLPITLHQLLLPWWQADRLMAVSCHPRLSARWKLMLF